MTTMKRALLYFVCIMGLGACSVAMAQRLFLQSFWQNTVPRRAWPSGPAATSLPMRRAPPTVFASPNEPSAR